MAPGWVSLRRVVGSRNRPLAALAPGRSEIFPGTRAFLWCRLRRRCAGARRETSCAAPGTAGDAGPCRRGACRLTAGRPPRRPARPSQPYGHDSWQFLDACAACSLAALPMPARLSGPSRGRVFPPASACPSPDPFASRERCFAMPEMPASGEPAAESAEPDGLPPGSAARVHGRRRPAHRPSRERPGGPGPDPAVPGVGRRDRGADPAAGHPARRRAASW